MKKLAVIILTVFLAVNVINSTDVLNIQNITVVDGQETGSL